MAVQSAQVAELNQLINRLERICNRLERNVSAQALESVNASLQFALTKSSEVTREEPVVNKVRLQSSEPAVNSNTTKQYLLDRPPIYNGESVDLDSLPTVLLDKYLAQDLPAQPPTASSFSDINTAAPSSTTTNLSSSTSTDTTSSTSIEMSVLGYQDIVSGPLSKYLELSKKIGGDVAKHADIVGKAFAAQLEFVKLAAASSRPGDQQLQLLLKPTSDGITEIQQFREQNRQSPLNNHLLAISESIPALGWVCVAPTPGPHVNEMKDASQFYTNRVLKDWKDKDAKHVDWARAWIETLTELQKFIKQHHTTGLVWSGKGAPQAVPSTGGLAPPPPPPPPPPMLATSDPIVIASDDEHNALFAQINQGADITKSKTFIII